MKIQKSLLALLFLLVTLFSNAQEPAYWMRLTDGLEFCDVQTASQNILVLVFRSEKLENSYAVAPSEDPSNYQVNGVFPSEVGRYSSTIFRYMDMYKNPLNGHWFLPEERYNPEMVMHKMYLFMPSDFVEGQMYTVTFPDGDTTFQFSKQLTYCESIKVNQVGYNHRSEKRRAFLNIWTGSTGPIEYTGTTDYEIYNAKDHSLASTGSFAAGEFINLDKGGYHYMLDLSALTDTGEYYLSIPGVGRSYDFGLGNKYAYHLYYTHMKGLFQQRCGMALEKPYTQWTHDTCHQEMYLMNVDPSNDKITVPDGLEPVPSIGGHHDAADFDQRSGHLMLPAWLMSAYEYAPEKLKDQELNIPESGNYIPDIIDEALWGIKRWETMQTEEGGIRAGIETNGHPQYGFINSERDESKYGTYRVEGFATLMGAGNMAYAARLIKPFDAARASELEAKALKAWDFYEANKEDITFLKPEWQAGSEWTPGPLMFAGLQLYLLTGEEKYHTAFKENYTDLMIDKIYGYPVAFQQYYYNGGTIKKGAVLTYNFISYAIDTVRAKDADIIDNIKQTIIFKADEFYNDLMDTENRYADLYNSGWGMGSGVGRWGDIMMWAHYFTGDQKYIDATSLCADFVLGANPMGICMTTGLGERPPYDPLIDAFDFIRNGLGPFPGVVLYFYGGTNSNNLGSCYPSFSELPSDRNFIDNWIHIGKSEFTHHETMIPNIFMYAALMEENDYYGAVMPFGDPSVFPGGHYNDIQNTAIENIWEPQVPLIPVELPEIPVNDIEMTAMQHVVIYPNPVKNGQLNIVNAEEISSVAIYTTDGKLIRQIAANREKRIHLSVNLPSGIYLLKLSNANHNEYKELIVN